jgi:hypothetical protein
LPSHLQSIPVYSLIFPSREFREARIPGFPIEKENKGTTMENKQKQKQLFKITPTMP